MRAKNALFLGEMQRIAFSLIAIIGVCAFVCVCVYVCVVSMCLPR